MLGFELPLLTLFLQGSVLAFAANEVRAAEK